MAARGFWTGAVRHKAPIYGGLGRGQHTTSLKSARRRTNRSRDRFQGECEVGDTADMRAQGGSGIGERGMCARLG
jgi:hypothetical protein